jgi:hypothetical protein
MPVAVALRCHDDLPRRGVLPRRQPEEVEPGDDTPTGVIARIPRHFVRPGGQGFVDQHPHMATGHVEHLEPGVTLPRQSESVPFLVEN